MCVWGGEAKNLITRRERTRGRERAEQSRLRNEKTRDNASNKKTRDSKTRKEERAIAPVRASQTGTLPIITFETKLTMAADGCDGSSSANIWHSFSTCDDLLPLTFFETKPKHLKGNGRANEWRRASELRHVLGARQHVDVAELMGPVAFEFVVGAAVGHVLFRKVPTRE